MGVRVYVELARRGFRRYATYRGAMLGGLFTNCVFGFLLSAVLLAVHRGAGEINGWDAGDAVTYTWAKQGLLTAVAAWGWDELSQRVRTGDIAVDLARPLDLHGQYLAADLGRAGFQLLGRGVVPLVVGSLAYRLELPGPALWPAIAASVVLAILVSFGVRFLANLATFWFLDNRGIQLVVTMVSLLLGGLIVPVAYFPDWGQAIAHATPFPSMFQAPLAVFLGKHGTIPLATLAAQAAWAAALAVTGRAVLAAGARRLVVQGG